MFRFWRGFRQDGVVPEDLIAKINARLIPETIRIGEKRGLTAYIPVFLPLRRPEGLPDETALVIYRNEETYNAIRSTNMGRAYGPIHFEPGAFSKDTSKSILLSNYEGVIPVGTTVGFILGDQNTDWQKGSTLFRVLSNTGDGTKTHLDRLQKKGAAFGINAAAVIVDPGYILEYLNFSNPELALVFESKLNSDEEIQSTIQIGADPVNKINIGAGEGSSIQFNSETAPPQDNLRVVLDEIRKMNGEQIK